MNSIKSVKNKNILFLQGPMGDFFKKLDTLFSAHGAKTYKIGFNLGDSFFSNHYNYTPYRDTKENYRAFIEAFVQKEAIDMIFLFGDCRFYQSIAIQVAKEMGIDVYVFEEGYIRPDYITMEKFGVNHYSMLPRDAAFYRALKLKEEPNALPTYNSQLKMVLSSILYYILGDIFFFFYPHYEHHREFSAFKEAFYGIRSFIRKQTYPFYEKKYIKFIDDKLRKNYFFVPLQTHNDFQILKHSPYSSVEQFIAEVLASYAKSGREEYLVLKHHPVDRGRKNYKNFIRKEAKALGIEKKVIVLYDAHLPTLLKNAKATITINSTVGLSSLYHNTPTLTLGSAIYDIEGLTSKGLTLDEFWHRQCEVERELLQKFRVYIIEKTQLNGSFYGKLPKFAFEDQ